MFGEGKGLEATELSLELTVSIRNNSWKRYNKLEILPAAKKLQAKWITESLILSEVQAYASQFISLVQLPQMLETRLKNQRK